MKRDVALERYLERHIEPGLPNPPAVTNPWRNVLVIPAYRESPELLFRLARSLQTAQASLVILVLNRPDTDADETSNTPLRKAISELPVGSPACYRLNSGCDLFCHDLESTSGPVPAKQGVGLARKAGCDIAALWMAQEAIDPGWICSSDADALLPEDYFDRLNQVPSDASAATFPFEHTPGPDPRCNAATALYELRLHHYVLGLDFAASPYAYHSLGSCLAIRFSTYTRVRGFPRRSGAEDFYLLNKARKLGPISRLQGSAIGLESRLSRRVPFGTGPAVEEIASKGDLEQQPRFYHPGCFEALRATLLTVPDLREAALSGLPDLLVKHGLELDIARLCSGILVDMGLEEAVRHCRKHGKTEEGFQNQFHQWFDAFRTLKYIHGLRAKRWPDQSLAELTNLTPNLWPVRDPREKTVAQLRDSVRRHWDWISPSCPGPTDS